MVTLEIDRETGTEAGPDRLRQAFAAVPTGVSVITTAGDGGPRGMTASAVCCVSLDPLLVLVCIANRSQTLEHILENGTFAVNVLRDSQSAVSSTFAGRAAATEKFASVSYRLVDGSPVLDDALAWVTCDVHATAPGGDHTIVVGRVSSVDARCGEPLVRHGGRYRRLGPDAD